MEDQGGEEHDLPSQMHSFFANYGAPPPPPPSREPPSHMSMGYSMPPNRPPQWGPPGMGGPPPMRPQPHSPQNPPAHQIGRDAYFNRPLPQQMPPPPPPPQRPIPSRLDGFSDRCAYGNPQEQLEDYLRNMLHIVDGPNPNSGGPRRSPHQDNSADAFGPPQGFGLGGMAGGVGVGAGSGGSERGRSVSYFHLGRTAFQDDRQEEGVQGGVHSRFFPSVDEMGMAGKPPASGSGGAQTARGDRESENNGLVGANSVEAFFAKIREVENQNSGVPASPTDASLNMFFSGVSPSSSHGPSNPSSFSSSGPPSHNQLPSHLQGPDSFPLPFGSGPNLWGPPGQGGYPGQGSGSGSGSGSGQQPGLNGSAGGNPLSRFFPEMGQRDREPQSYPPPGISAKGGYPDSSIFGHTNNNNMSPASSFFQQQQSQSMPQGVRGGGGERVHPGIVVSRVNVDREEGGYGKEREREREREMHGDDDDGRGRDNMDDMGDDQDAPRPKRPPKPMPDFSPYRLRELDEQIIAALHRITPLPQELALRSQLCDKMERIVRSIWPSARVKLYGSSGNSFGLRGADIDMCLFYELGDEETPAAIINRLADLLDAIGMQDILPLPDARVPIVKFKDNETGIPIDMCLNNHLAVNNTEFLAMYGNIDKRVVHLSRILKLWAKRRNINEPYTGTLSSYAYVLLAIFFCQTRPVPIVPNLQAIPPPGQYDCPVVMINGHNCYYYKDLEGVYRMGYGPYGRNKETLAELLLAFFHLFAYNFGYQWDVVSVRTASLMDKKEKEWTLKHNTKKDRFWLCIEDPFETSHNLGRLADKNTLYDIRGEFMRAFRVLGSGGSIEELCRPYEGPQAEKKLQRGMDRSPKLRLNTKNLSSPKGRHRSSSAGSDGSMSPLPGRNGPPPRVPMHGLYDDHMDLRGDYGKGPRPQQQPHGGPRPKRPPPGTHSSHRSLPAQAKAHQKLI